MDPLRWQFGVSLGAALLLISVPSSSQAADQSAIASAVVDLHESILAADAARPEAVAAGSVVPPWLGALLAWQRQPERWRLVARQSIVLPN